jgi:hypothetical protein
MSFFQFFYCRAYKYYNIGGNRDETTLRGSAIAALSTLEFLNLLTLIVFLNIFLDGAIYLNKWICGGGVILTLVYNFWRYNAARTLKLREMYMKLDRQKYLRMMVWVRLYIFISMVVVILAIVYGRERVALW